MRTHTLILRKDITEENAINLLKSAKNSVPGAATPEDREAALQVLDNIAQDIAIIFPGGAAFDILEAAFGFAVVPAGAADIAGAMPASAIVPGTNRRV